MGCWGMGLNQSDEYCEVYENFMQSYDKGMAVAEIRQEILSQYRKEFEKDDPILHDVYFALAKAGWMCCDQSSELMDRVKTIIESGANLAFYRELGADDRDLALRQKKLRAFWDSLQTPRAKPRKRHPAPREKKESGPVNGLETGKIDRLLARVGVDEDEDFYRELDGLLDSLGRNAKNPAELRYAYGLLMELSQHPKSSVRMAVLRALGVMAMRHKKAPLSEAEIKDRIYAQWRQGDPAERAVLKDVMEELRQSRGWQFVLP